MLNGVEPWWLEDKGVEPRGEEPEEEEPWSVEPYTMARGLVFDHRYLCFCHRLWKFNQSYSLCF